MQHVPASYSRFTGEIAGKTELLVGSGFTHTPVPHLPCLDLLHPLALCIVTKHSQEYHGTHHTMVLNGFYYHAGLIFAEMRSESHRSRPCTVTMSHGFQLQEFRRFTGPA